MRILIAEDNLFAALELDVREPAAYDAAIRALHELEEMARAGTPPFDRE